MRRAAGGELHPSPAAPGPDGQAAPERSRALRHGSAGSRSRAEQPPGMSGEKGMASAEEEEGTGERATIPKKGNEKDENIPFAGGKVRKWKQ